MVCQYSTVFDNVRTTDLEENGTSTILLSPSQDLKCKPDPFHPLYLEYLPLFLAYRFIPLPCQFSSKGIDDSRETTMSTECSKSL